MTGISEADMNRINEFVAQTKFERSPEQLCPNEEEDDDETDDAARRPQTAAAEG
ncbi:hypothetical protein [Halorubrum sp. SD683]|uniref:hypothetical protein n=1 Tax=Halorubrum sp. SD683 TaxID=1855873 RepID=UPI0013027AF9|nr:hypothetical protein [Halorubrum sp. SD683]